MSKTIEFAVAGGESRVALDPIAVKGWTDRKAPKVKAHFRLDFLKAMHSALSDFQQHLIGNTVQFAAEWIRWLEQWVKLHTAGKKLQEDYETAPEGDKWRFLPQSYVVGEVVFADLGVGVHTEASFPHPCIVLYNGWYTLQVVPMTHTQRTGNLLVPSNFRGQTGTIEVNQIRTISKQRVINRMGTVAGTAEFAQTLQQMLKHYLPDAHQELTDLREKTKQLEGEKERLVKALDRMKDERRALYQRIADLENALKESAEALGTPAAAKDDPS